MTSISSSLSGSSLYSTSLSSLDTNGDGIVSAEELAAAEKATGTQRTQDPTVENENAASGLSSQVAGGVMAMLLANSGDEANAQADDRQFADELFARLDADGDGKVSQSEFVASRPDAMSEEEATALFAKFDGEGTGSLTEDQFVSAMEELRSEGPPPPPPVDDQSAEDDDTVSLFDVLEEMKQVIAAYSAFTEQQESEAEAPSDIRLTI
ncbi:MAG: EF-hand domain-containing protein [Rhizobium sp.]|nr:EF-hand domain-containing protein [Rhizobium sp.]